MADIPEAVFTNIIWSAQEIWFRRLSKDTTAFAGAVLAELLSTLFAERFDTSDDDDKTAQRDEDLIQAHIKLVRGMLKSKRGLPSEEKSLLGDALDHTLEIYDTCRPWLMVSASPRMSDAALAMLYATWLVEYAWRDDPATRESRWDILLVRHMRKVKELALMEHEADPQPRPNYDDLHLRFVSDVSILDDPLYKTWRQLKR